MRKVISIVLALFMAFGLAIRAYAEDVNATAEVAEVVEETVAETATEGSIMAVEDNTTTPVTLAGVLEQASSEGFLYEFEGDNQVFDGTRIVSGTTEDIARLKASNEGTGIVSY